MGGLFDAWSRPYVFPHEEAFALVIGALIVGLLVVRVGVLRRRRQRDHADNSVP